MNFLISLNSMPQIFLLLVMFAMMTGLANAQTKEVVRVAVLADKGIESAEHEWAPVFAWLNRSVTGRSFVLVGLDHPELRQAVHDRSVNFVITNAGNYSELGYSNGITRIATLDSPLALSPTLAVGSAIVVRADSGLTQLADLKGKHLLAASSEAFCCYQVAARELVLAGIDPKRDLGRLEFIGFPIQSIALAVQDGKADAGIIKTCLLEQMIERGEIRPQDLRVLSPKEIPGFPCQTSSRLYPDWPFATLTHTSAELSRKVAVALLEMPRTPEGYRWTTPAHYAVVDELFRDLKIGHYANLQKETLEALVWRYRIELLVAVILIFIWIIHTVRVDYLVSRRTRELKQMHEEKQRMTEAMRARQNDLDHAGRLAVLGGMASAIAHELRQPLAAIANFARGMDRRIDAGRLEPVTLREGCHEIAQQSARADATIEKIRNFARKGASAMQPVNLASYVKEAADLFSVAHPEARINWSDMDKLGDTRVMADPIQIQQVTFNLLKNAFDAQSARGNRRSPVEVTLAYINHGYQVSVRDKGGGLKDEHIAHLFEPFFTTKADGLGLGLPLSKGIIESHGGTLTLVKETDGVCASFWLPEEHTHE
ncbi:MAG: PhnD/SsuA/transferrin family substrate-binding protein [Rhodocyclaceae bacterium]|nr:PhnD/SsuA/transferrin family substrate-binding protein [Rhodocyclaceae bacterium]